MSFGHALYYPYINLTNKNWVKHALLFWDNISRIVPQSIEPMDSEDIIKIKEESGFINDYYPERWDISHTFHDFSRELKPILESNRFLSENIITDNIGEISKIEEDFFLNWYKQMAHTFMLRKWILG